MNDKYLKLKNKHQAELNALPIKYAFGKQQYNKMLESFNITQDEAPKLLFFVGSGGYMFKSDTKKLKDFYAKREQEIQDARKDSEYCFEMFKYELANHEYGYTYNVDDTLHALDLTLEQVKENDILNEAFNKALALDWTY